MNLRSNNKITHLTQDLLTLSRCRAVTGLHTGHNTLRTHLHLMGISDSPLRGRCGAEEEISANILCECETLASFRHAYLGSCFLDTGDVKSISLEPQQSNRAPLN